MEQKLTQKQVCNFKNKIIETNKYLLDSELEMMLIYDGNPYCHEYSLNCKLQSKGKELLKALEEYEKALGEYTSWVNK